MTRKIEVRMNVSPSLHPETVAQRWAKVLGADARPVKAATDGSTVLYETIGKMHDALGIARRGAKERVSGLEDPLARAAKRMVSRTETVLGRELATIKGERTRLQKMIDDAMNVEPKFGAEARARCAAISTYADSDGQIAGEKAAILGRKALVRELIQAGERDSALAILQAPGWLSGLPAGATAELRAEAERAWYPSETKQIAALDEMTALLDSGAQTLAQTYGEVLAQVEQARAIAATSDKAQALDRLAAEVEALTP